MNIATVNCIVVVEVQPVWLEGDGPVIAYPVSVRRFPAEELRAKTGGELDAQARSHALRTIRLENKSNEEAPDVELIQIVEIIEIEECASTCFSCFHQLKKSNQMPCCRCNSEYNMWK